MFLLTVGVGAAFAMTVRADDEFTITHENGFEETVRIEAFYPSDAEALIVRRNKTTFSVTAAEIARMERVSKYPSRFTLTLAGGETMTVSVIDGTRVEGVGILAPDKEGRYCCSLNRITAIERVGAATTRDT